MLYAVRHGPASRATRRAAPELDGHGHPKIVPMAGMPDFRVTAGRDPRGLVVRGDDGLVAGMVSDMWIDAPERQVRHLKVTVSEGAKHTISIRLVRISQT